MNVGKQFIRLFYINYVLARHGIDRVIFETKLFSPFRFLSYFNPWNWWRKKTARGETLKNVLQDLGPIFVKFGQMLSTRHDLLPEDIILELAKLQDAVPPFPSAQAIKLVEKEFNQPLDNIFLRFSKEALASASIAQVHAAELADGREVIVKILRPGILNTIRKDIGLLYTVASLTEKFWSHGKRLRPKEIVAEFEHTLLDELDLMYEAANASQLRRNFLFSEKLYIPQVFWRYTYPSVMVMERIKGIPIGDMASLRKKKVNLKVLAERGVEIFFMQVFRDSFFHADMHPGNIFVDAQDPDNPKYIAVDFGIMGSLSEEDQNYLAENLLAFFHRDYYRVAKLHIDSGWVPPNTRPEAFAAAIRTVSEPIFERPLKDISFAQLLMHLFRTARRFNMQVQPQLMLLQKTLLNIEALGRYLYSDIDLWVTARPFVEDWFKKKYGFTAFVKTVKEELPRWLHQLTKTPDLIYQHLEKEKMQIPERVLKKSEKMMKQHSGYQYFGLGVGLGFLITGLFSLFLNNSDIGHTLGWVMGGVGVLWLISSLIVS